MTAYYEVQRTHKGEQSETVVSESERSLMAGKRKAEDDAETMGLTVKWENLNGELEAYGECEPDSNYRYFVTIHESEDNGTANAS